MTNPKICVHCKHVGTNGSGDASRYRCMAAPNIMTQKTDLVTGRSYNVYRHETCYLARVDYPEDSCGLEGKWFEPRPPIETVQGYQPNPAPATGATKQHAAAADLLNQLKSL